MSRSATALPRQAEIFSTEFRSLLEQLGSPEENFAFTGAFPELETVTSADALRRFLFQYQEDVLLRLELPAICRAYHHACRNECRELISLDRSLARETQLQYFASASQRIGRLHLSRFRSMRERFVQRYLHAVDVGDAHGWHTLVFGMSLAVYSLPLRQGLNFYAGQVLRGFAVTAAHVHHLPQNACDNIVSAFSADCSAAIDSFLAPGVFTR